VAGVHKQQTINVSSILSNLSYQPFQLRQNVYGGNYRTIPTKDFSMYAHI